MIRRLVNAWRRRKRDKLMREKKLRPMRKGTLFQRMIPMWLDDPKRSSK